MCKYYEAYLAHNVAKKAVEDLCQKTQKYNLTGSQKQEAACKLYNNLKASGLDFKDPKSDPQLMDAIKNGDCSALNTFWKTNSQGVPKETALKILSQNDAIITSAGDGECGDVVNTLTVTATMSKQPSCSNMDGEVEVTASGGSGRYEYRKSPLDSWQVSSIFKGLKAGSYTFEARDNEGSKGSASVEIKIETQVLNPDLESVTNTNELNCEQKEKLKLEFKELMGDCVFTSLKDNLKLESVKFNFKMGGNVGGQNATAGYNYLNNDLLFSTIGSIQKPNITHEIFHGFQNKFYVGGLGQYLNVGRINIEFEARLFEMIMGYVNENLVFGGFSSFYIVDVNDRDLFNAFFEEITSDGTKYPVLWNEKWTQYFGVVDIFKKSVPAYNYPIDFNLKPEALLTIFKQSNCQKK